MAALCPGVQYGLSQQQHFGENKDYVFVKLTDSALRAIEDFVRNQNKFSQSPTIKFVGNENGELSFPSVAQSGSTSFRFTMSSNADMEGPGGSFECVQQLGTPRGALENLGSMGRKIRVHANDDVYETTRTRMTEAEDKHRNKCTREIKPNQTDIGRKVKVKQQLGGGGPALQQRVVVPPRREVPSMRESLLKQPSSGGYQAPPMPQQSVLPKAAPAVNGAGLSNGLGSNHVSSSRPLNKPSVPDIVRRPLRERLIHMLALKPHKKVELYERLYKEGLREKNGWTSVLKQVAFLRDNCYHLNRAMWNEVQEDWQFYSESEKQILKRRKPQNLTPPGGSDGSSGSGQSPTSTHPGSPPPPPIGASSKRPGFFDGPDGIPSKRQRVSHYRKPPDQPQSYRGGAPGGGSNSIGGGSTPTDNSQRRPMTDSRDSSNMNPRSRESPTNHYFNSMNGGGASYGNGGASAMLNDKRGLSDDEDGTTTTTTKKRSCDSHSLSFGVNREKTLVNGRSAPGGNPAKSPAKAQLQQQQQGDKDAHYQQLQQPHEGRNAPAGTNSSSMSSARLKEEKDRNKYNKVTSSTQNRIARVSPDSQSETLLHNMDGGAAMTMVSERNKDKMHRLKEVVVDDEEDPYPDFHTQYTTIKNLEQRRCYKADFNADYTEYRNLHGIVEKVSRKFAQLEERLKQENEHSPGYKDIKNQIFKEYHDNKNDLKHQKAKKRFNYLHEKLSHIKQLVFEFDKNVSDARY